MEVHLTILFALLTSWLGAISPVFDLVAELAAPAVSSPPTTSTSTAFTSSCYCVRSATSLLHHNATVCLELLSCAINPPCGASIHDVWKARFSYGKLEASCRFSGGRLSSRRPTGNTLATIYLAWLCLVPEFTIVTTHNHYGSW